MDKKKKIELVISKIRELMPKLPYHNFNHAIDVYSAVNNLIYPKKINFQEKFLLQTAALLHDAIFVPKREDNEEKSVEFAKKFLLKIGYSEKQIEKIIKLILATKMPQNPKNFSEKIICDADLDYLGRKDFFEKNEKLRIEEGLPKNQWYQKALRFLKNHEYHTGTAKKLRNKGKEENIQKFKKLIE